MLQIDRGVAQLVARLLWEQDAGSSSLFTPTIETVMPLALQFLFLWYSSDFGILNTSRRPHALGIEYDRRQCRIKGV